MLEVMKPSTPSLLADATTHITDEMFRLHGLLLILALIPVSVLPLVAGPDLSSFHWSVSVFSWLFKMGPTCYTLLVLRGCYVYWRGQLPLVKDDAAKYIEVITTSSNNNNETRTIEYYVYGSDKDDATPLVVLHGSGSTGKYFNQCAFPDEVLKKLNVRAISPSYPGHGGSDVDVYRRITDWPITDLLPILKEENVNKFLVIGTSYGTAHAMATASALPNRCLGLGLNAPYLPENICREANFWTDADMILGEKQLEQPWILLPLVGVLGFAQWLIPTGICSYPEGKIMVNKYPELFDVLKKDAARSFLRGVNGQVYEMLNAATTQTWPDPRNIKVKNIVLWYAQDDSIVPPEHGKWLEKSLSSNGRNLNVKSEKSGLGHFTYLTPEYSKTAVMTKALLDMVASSEKKCLLLKS